MENEKNDLININDNDISNKSFFKLEYKEQELNLDNMEYKNWQKTQIDILGDDIIIYKCKKDNILFYDSSYNTKKNSYECKCPKCQLRICCFCNIALKPEDFNTNCCIKRKIKSIFFKSSKIFLSRNKSLACEHFFFLIPFFSLIYFITGIQNSLFISLLKIDFNLIEDELINYEKYYIDKNMNVYWTIIVFITLFDFFIMIPFVILDLYITIVLLIISIPFKKPPIKYVLGFLIMFLED